MQANHEFYTCKWGRVSILIGDNYPWFSQTCKAALISSSTWPIVNGTKLRTRNAQSLREWDDLNARGAMIIFNSVSSNLQTTINTEIDTQDTVAMWRKLTVYDRSTDNIFAGNLKAQFYAERFIPDTETLCMFVLRLETIQAQLANTTFALSERDMIDRILQALPDTSQWQSQRQFCYRENLNLAQTINSLQSVELSSSSISSTSGQTAFLAHTNTGKMKCYFCGRNGHLQAKCRKYKQAQKRAREESSDESSSDDKTSKKKKKKSVHAFTAITTDKDLAVLSGDFDDYSDISVQNILLFSIEHVVLCDEVVILLGHTKHVKQCDVYTEVFFLQAIKSYTEVVILQAIQDYTEEQKCFILVVYPASYRELYRRAEVLYTMR